MNIIYGVCYYYERLRYNSIFNHINSYKKLVNAYPQYSFKFIVNVMCDDKDVSKRDEKISLLKDNIKITDIDYLFLHEFNYGGTIAGLYNTYHYVKENKLYDNLNTYIMYFEEDFYPINNDFLKDSLTILKTSDNIYIGESTRGSFKMDNTHNPILSSYYHMDIIAKWTDGGFYFSSFANFNKIYEKIGNFHKGDTTTLYDHLLDGIRLGEVGFPSLIHKSGYNFTGLLREKYFIHLYNNILLV